MVQALEVAARAGWNAGAFAEAQQQIREAIRLAPAADHLRLYELLGDVMQFGDDAIDGYKQAYEQWRATPGGAPGVGARLLVKNLVVHGRWAGSVSRPLEPTEFNDMIAEAEPLVARSDDPTMVARLALAAAFKRTSEDLTDRNALDRLAARVVSAERVFQERGDHELQSESLDALGAIHRSAGDIEAALECDRRRIAMSDRLGVLERADAWSVAVWDLVYLGRFDEAVRTAAEAQRSMRPGEPRSMMCHVAAWAAYGAMLCGHWDEAVDYVELLVTLREEFGQVIGRFTTPGWLAGLRDPFIGKALSLMHAKPAWNWTIEELAKDVGLSRSVLAERFAGLVGMPPMYYLAKWRMQIASGLLSGDNTNIATVAAEVGYGSEAAFSRAFKKMVGVPPSAWRRRLDDDRSRRSIGPLSPDPGGGKPEH